jgi:alkanesulfonate monooxygenase SsuD/methylene tetrahydromethanopterin reductase-like flavin-dependent oxidoreductase (luciferase family)/GNAT superfamily N-acetyltransferase
MTRQVAIERTAWLDPRIVAMRDAMDAEVQPLYADLRADAPRIPVDEADILVTLVALAGGEPVGTAALKRTGPFGEVKRVFVTRAGRRLGIATTLMRAIEREAAGLGYRELFLQTGRRQPEAMALYEREGWIPVAPFGPYESDTLLSRCYVKPLARPVVAAEVRAATAEGDDAALRVLDEVVALDEAGADLALVDDDYLRGEGTVTLDAPMLAAATAARTTRISVAPRIRVTHTEPFHVSKTVQTLDWVTRGRAGWVVDVSPTEEEARAFGRRPAPGRDDAWEEAGAVVEASRALWDSWEDDAEIRDVGTGRFIDRDRVHHIRFESRWFDIIGPSIVPRSPQGQIPVIVDLAAHQAVVSFAAEHADVVRVRESDPRTARELVERVRAEAGREVTVLVDLDPADVVRAPHARSEDEQAAAWATSLRAATGADGVVLTGDAASVRAAARAVSAGGGPVVTLRQRLGLARPASRYRPELVGASAATAAFANVPTAPSHAAGPLERGEATAGSASRGASGRVGLPTAPPRAAGASRGASGRVGPGGESR